MIVNYDIELSSLGLPSLGPNPSAGYILILQYNDVEKCWEMFKDVDSPPKEETSSWV